KVFIIKNNLLGQIKWEQMTFLGNPEFAVDLQPIDFVKFAEACGVTGLRLERAEDCQQVVAQALATPGPVVVEALVDALEPPMPPKVTADQAIKLSQSLLRGEPDAGEIIRTIFS